MKRGDNLRKYQSGPTHRTNVAEYRAWSSMKVRCLNPSFKDWHLYGGKGITVCDRWRKSFAAFFSDVGPRPGLGYSLDRFPDNQGNYEPGNVRWATSKQQARNWSSRNRKIEFNGENLTIGEWAERIGIQRESLRDRLEGGWDVGLALTTPPVRIRERDARGIFKPFRD